MSAEMSQKQGMRSAKVCELKVEGKAEYNKHIIIVNHTKKVIGCSTVDEPLLLVGVAMAGATFLDDVTTV